MKIYETSGDKIQLRASGPDGIQVNRSTDKPKGNKFQDAMRLQKVYKEEIAILGRLLKLENKTGLYL